MLVLTTHSNPLFNTQILQNQYSTSQLHTFFTQISHPKPTRNCSGNCSEHIIEHNFYILCQYHLPRRNRKHHRKQNKQILFSCKKYAYSPAPAWQKRSNPLEHLHPSLLFLNQNQKLSKSPLKLTPFLDSNQYHLEFYSNLHSN